MYETEHLNVFKTLCLEDCSIWGVKGEVKMNKSFIGFLLTSQPPQFHLVGKKDLFNREIPPEKTFQRQITIEGYNYKTDLNTTSIVVLQKEELFAESEQEESEYLLKRKDFWI